MGMFLSYWVLKSFLISISGISVNMAEGGSRFKQTILKRDKVMKYEFDKSYKDFLKEVKKNEPVLKEFIRILKDSNFGAYFFETPKVTSSTVEKKIFEFVLVKAEALEGVKAEEDTFKSYFDKCGGESNVAAFENLGGDAMLVAPCPQENWDFSSLATFMRTADLDQVNKFWIKSAETMLDRIENIGLSAEVLHPCRIQKIVLNDFVASNK